MRHSASASTSGIAVDTTCKPAARYSRALSGFAFNVSSLTRNGINATSKPLQYAGSAPYGLRPSRWTLGRRSSAETSVVALPSATSDPVEKRSATLAINPTSTQSAIRPKKPITGRGREAISSGTTVSASGSSTFNRGHLHHLAILALRAFVGRPRGILGFHLGGG